MKVNLTGKKHEKNSDLLKIVCKFKLLGSDKDTKNAHVHRYIHTHIYSIWKFPIEYYSVFNK